MRPATARRLAWVLFALTVALSALYPVLYYADQHSNLQAFGLPAVNVPATIATALLGAIVASRYPRNPIGWIFLVASGLLGAITGDSQLYAVLALREMHPHAPGGATAAWLGSWLFEPGVDFPFTIAVLLFPDGHLPSHRWRGFGRALGVLLVVATVTAAIGALPARPGFQITAGGSITENDRIGLEVFQLPVMLAALVCLASVLQRFRRSRGDEREQMKWFMAAIALVIAALALSFSTSFTASGTPAPWAGVMFEVAGLSVPAAMAFAILKYRLYDIDVVISRALVFGSLAALITAVYVGIAVGIGSLVGSGGRPNLGLSILATAIVAVGFQPVRERLQRVANRLVYGERATPYEVLSQFSERVAESYATDEVMPRMARVLAEGTGAQRADVWLRTATAWREAAVWPFDAPLRASVPVDNGTLPSVHGNDVMVPVRHQGDLLGALSVTKRAGETLTPVEENLLTHLAGQAGLVLKNVGLSADLQARLDELRASRQRLVTAQDEARRRLERNLHDGAQQHLVALKVKLGLAEMLMARDPEKARVTLAQLKADADEALETLRDLARGIYPPLLADKGLAAALESQARKATVPVTVDAAALRRYSQEIEAAVYFCCLEAMQNIQKYAHASRATIRLREQGTELLFEIEDDGDGFDVATTRKGAGLSNMVDRFDALGGEVQVTSTPGHGTRIHGLLPVVAA